MNISASNGITFTNINANGGSGARGAIVTLTSPGQAITGNYISATGSGGNGGSVTTFSSTLVLNGVDTSGDSVNTQSTGGNGGIVSITTTSPLVFTVGHGGNLTGNGTAGNINANGVNGGSITLTNYGNTTTGNQVINGSVTASGTTGNGGTILFQGQPSSTLTTTVNGLVQASNNANNSGVIGFNSGPGQNVNLLGTGTINGGTSVNIGNLNPGTLALLPQPAGTVIIAQTLTITNAVQNNGFVPPGPPSPSSITSPTFGSFGLFGITSLPGTTSAFLQLPSLTATDQTQIFGFTSLGTELTEEEEDQSDDSYTVANEEDKLIPGTTLSAFNFGSDEVVRLQRDGVSVSNESRANALMLKSGNILTSPDRDILIVTNNSRISVKAGATVFIMTSGENVVVYDLGQTKPQQVYVDVNKQRMMMEPGRMLAITNQNVQQLQNLPVNCHAVAYSQPQTVDVNDKVKVFAANFSVASAFSTIRPLKGLTTSPYKQDQITLARLWKNSQIEGDFARSTQPPFQNADMGR